MEMKPTEVSSSKMFEGYNKRYKHFSPTLGCSMNFHIYFPPSPSPSHKFPVCISHSSPIFSNTHFPIPLENGSFRFDCCSDANASLPGFYVSRIGDLCFVLYWLSGLTCTDENFIIKSGAQRAASSESIALVVPDTSPRGLNVEGEADSWDFGLSAGFYLNATQEKWKNWRMYDYVAKELPKLLNENFPQIDTSRAGISGHSMGGHGALTIYLKNLDKYKSVSAFAPIVNPINCPWGQKAFTNYLGGNKADWEDYDATCLISKFNDVSATILIDQGEADKLLHDQQLLPHKFEEACRKANVPLLLRLCPGYDHSYNFIATFIDDHIRHHAQAVKL
ncbi:hypothetical protein RJ639_008711 [Escallonia herrerae]|uniref:S-formylglutathione hydrolase n=1 Tax=Escallonia herrerae TaxID=1293975 RepID=A0AA88VV99_9ASTE|nr:hypothetical protein RJ639_008711 [Escallonia herrerae]